MLKEKTLKEIIAFLFLVVVFSSFFYFLMIRAGTIHSRWNLTMLGLMWSPALAAITTQFIYDKKINKTIFKLYSYRYLAISYLIPFLYLFITYLIVWITGLGGFFNTNFLAIVKKSYHFAWMDPLLFHILYSITLGVGVKSVFTLGEEWGWRGFLVPKLLQLTSARKTAMISGIIWAMWHYPMIIFLDYNGRTSLWFGLICFTVMIVGLSFLYTWIWIKTKSIWTVVILHASHNLFIQQIFSPVTYDTGNTKYIIGEFGLGVLFVGVVLTALFWKNLNNEQALSAVDTIRRVDKKNSR